MNFGSFNAFGNQNLVQTPINDAYKYKTHSEFINRMKPPSFSQTCVFCSSLKTDSLTIDGSFRRCGSCRKDFKAIIINR
jgi:hypothetical protein